MSGQYEIVERVPTIEEYRFLCAAVGWEAVMNLNAASKALPNSLYGVVAICDGQTIGMGRVVGDGAIFYYVQDVAVLPAHQGKGVGSQIVGRLTDMVKREAPEKAFLGVFAAEGTLSFYERFGFGQHPILTGMFQVVPSEEEQSQ
ncbi:MAG: GNAT family N-acetyltransferase [Anaerolineae bacterium]|nr:GNAT family N-acetyltransferase [Anaerolineae bacterium]